MKLIGLVNTIFCILIIKNSKILLIIKKDEGEERMANSKALLSKKGFNLLPNLKEW
jgi:hypothetical protein